MIDFSAVLPEASLTALACLVLLVDVFRAPAARGWTFWTASVAVLIVLATIAWGFPAVPITVFDGSFRLDAMGAVLKAMLMVVVLLSFFYARDYFERHRSTQTEFYILALFASIGMMVLISAHNLLTVYLGLELLSLSLYAMVAMDRDSPAASEAAMKYFVLGALASGMLLYGISMLYGVSGSLDLSVLAQHSMNSSKELLYTFGLVFVIIGIAFKLGVAPFHMWVPDVYHGAPTAITLMIGGAPKLAAFAIVIRLLVEGLQPLAVDWQQMLAVLAVMSLLIGNLAAIAQTNLKRMLAFSTIAQMGFMLLGLLAGVVQGDSSNMANAYASSMFYVVTYVLTTLGTFGVILLLSRSGFESENVSDLAGLNQRSPLYAGVMAICMFSLAGVPPLVGFYAKLSVLQALLASSGAFYVGLAVFAVVMSLIGAFYYLRLVKVMYFDAPTQTAAIEGGADARSVLSLNGALVLVLGILPGGLMTLCAQAVSELIG